ncbi:hypothetical protein BU25DRAFT_24799 [Macroventuria anomochaeta]|uniref:Uncharacterized protein n=1 Tax=Macroventuria anomochaeta TaxID=301207 RepID=A0ACB6S4J6_9PLEO|nr:uncharacterized protein BU25DRAFT_24799 [Macroventuria anomochaeta]KAF2628968.1 hypothetical protein BU25DRAFT_24799 [Macroventuria anomochaeta]
MAYIQLISSFMILFHLQLLVAIDLGCRLLYDCETWCEGKVNETWTNQLRASDVLCVLSNTGHEMQTGQFAQSANGVHNSKDISFKSKSARSSGCLTKRRHPLSCRHTCNKFNTPSSAQDMCISCNQYQPSATQDHTKATDPLFTFEPPCHTFNFSSSGLS